MLCFLWFAIGFAFELVFEVVLVFLIMILLVLLKSFHWCLLYMCSMFAVWFELHFLCSLNLLCLSQFLFGFPYVFAMHVSLGFAIGLAFYFVFVVFLVAPMVFLFVLLGVFHSGLLCMCL